MAFQDNDAELLKKWPIICLNFDNVMLLEVCLLLNINPDFNVIHVIYVFSMFVSNKLNRA